MKKKIGIITLHLGFGGVELASINLANMLVNDYDVSIINVYKSEIAFDIDKNVKVVNLSNFNSNKKEFIELIENKRYIKAFKEGIRSIKILYLRTKLVKKYLTNNSFDILISSRLLYTNLIGKMKINSIKIGIEHRHHNNSKKYIKKVVRIGKKIDYLIPVSNGLTKDYKKYLGSKCINIPNCIDYFPKEYNNEKDKIIISVGRLSPEKGFDDLVRIFEKIYSNHKDWKLIIAGDGPEKDKIEEIISNSNCKNNIKLLGFVQKKELYELYNKSSIYIMTSHEEAFPLVIMEAQSFGIPCVTFSTAYGATEMINNENGFVIEGRNAEKMISSVTKIIEKPEFRKKLSDNSRRNSEKYTIENIAKIWLNFLRKL